MREQFRQEMHDLTKTLTLEAQAAAKAMKRAAAALKNANLAVAEQVIDSDSRIDLLERHIDDMGISMLARQAQWRRICARLSPRCAFRQFWSAWAIWRGTLRMWRVAATRKLLLKATFSRFYPAWPIRQK